MNASEKAQIAARQVIVWGRDNDKPITRYLIDQILSRDAHTLWGDANVRTVRMRVRKLAVLQSDRVALTDREEVTMHKDRLWKMTLQELWDLRDEIAEDENDPRGWDKNFVNALSKALR